MNRNDYLESKIYYEFPKVIGNVNEIQSEEIFKQIVNSYVEQKYPNKEKWKKNPWIIFNFLLFFLMCFCIFTPIVVWIGYLGAPFLYCLLTWLFAMSIGVIGILLGILLGFSAPMFPRYFIIDEEGICIDFDKPGSKDILLWEEVTSMNSGIIMTQVTVFSEFNFVSPNLEIKKTMPRLAPTIYLKKDEYNSLTSKWHYR